MWNRVSVSVCVLIAVGCFAGGWQLRALFIPKGEVARAFEIRTREGRREVNADGRWYPLVDRTDSPLERFIPPTLSPGQVVHLNADGTALLTDEREASQRSQRDPRKQHGWPLPD